MAIRLHKGVSLIANTFKRNDPRRPSALQRDFRPCKELRGRDAWRAMAKRLATSHAAQETPPRSDWKRGRFASVAGTGAPVTKYSERQWRIDEEVLPARERLRSDP